MFLAANFASIEPMRQPRTYFVPSLLLLYLLVSFTCPFFLSYSLHLFSCFSIPAHSARIFPLFDDYEMLMMLF